MRLVFSFALVLASSWLAVSAMAAPPQLDVAELVRRYQSAVATQPPAQAVVLVSFNMPKESLQRLIRDSARVKVPLILRGLVANSMLRTLARMREFDPNGTAQWQVDPRPFRTLDVHAVPVFAVQQAKQWQMVRGDVSLGYALNLIAQAGGVAGQLATQLAGQLAIRSP